MCSTDQLEASLGPGSGGGAGHQYPTLVLTNSGTTSCTMSGYPGVSFVGGSSGTQLGDAAARDTTVAATTLTVEPGASVHADLDITQAANYPEDTCGPTPATGLRVYPPDQTAALFVASDDFTACANAGTTLITVRPVQAGSE